MKKKLLVFTFSLIAFLVIAYVFDSTDRSQGSITGKAIDDVISTIKQAIHKLRSTSDLNQDNYRAAVKTLPWQPCNNCFVNPSLTPRQKSNLEQALQSIREANNKITQALSKRTTLPDIGASIQQLQEEITEAKNRLIQARQSLAELPEEHTVLISERIQTTEQHIDDLQSSVTLLHAFSDVIHDANEKINTIKKDITRTEEDLNILTEE